MSQISSELSEENEGQRRNSIDIAKIRWSTSLRQSKVDEYLRVDSGCRRFTLQLPQVENPNEYRERVITAYLLKDIAPITVSDDPMRPQKVYKGSRQNSFRGVLLLGRKHHPMLQFYMKTLQQVDQSDLLQSNEILIENALIAGKYVNNFGLFCILKEILIKRSIKTIVVQDVAADNEAQVIQQINGIKLNNNCLGLIDLHYINGQISLYKFNIYHDQPDICSRNSKQQEYINQIEQQIKQCLENMDYDIVFIYLDPYLVQFTIPQLQDNQISRLIQVYNRKYNNKMDTQQLINHFVFRMSDLNSFQNREIGKEWKYFALQGEQGKDIGFMQLNNPQIHKSIPNCNQVEVKIYGETHHYKVILKIGELGVSAILVADSQILQQ